MPSWLVQIRPAIPVVQILGRVRSPGPPVGTVIPEGPAQRQDRSSSLCCGRSVVTPALTQCCLPGGRKPAKPLVNNPVDKAPSLQGSQCYAGFVGSLPNGGTTGEGDPYAALGGLNIRQRYRLSLSRGWHPVPDYCAAQRDRTGA